ncbi:MAG: hypothetical protein Q4P23_12225, partial [Micrococcaceae bacterium]|nr:hypothetical protein [Micrococcaceae bacterium]
MTNLGTTGPDELLEHVRVIAAEVMQNPWNNPAAAGLRLEGSSGCPVMNPNPAVNAGVPVSPRWRYG